MLGKMLKEVEALVIFDGILSPREGGFRWDKIKVINSWLKDLCFKLLTPEMRFFSMSSFHWSIGYLGSCATDERPLNWETERED